MSKSMFWRGGLFSDPVRQIGASAPLAPRTGGNENTGFLKLCAILFMLVDHIGVAFFPGVKTLRIIGRIAFPLFVWCLCVGVEYTRNIWKYALRLLLIGVLSQPPFMLALNHQWYQLNVFATLLMGVLGIAAIRTNKFGSCYWGPALALLIPCAVAMDYGWMGVLFIFLLYACRKQRSSIAALMIAYCLYWGYGTYNVEYVLGIPLPTAIRFLPNSTRLLADIGRIQFWAILSLPLMLWPMRSRLRLPKWAGYAAYPAHLLVIGVIRRWTQIMDFLGR
ncbi:MAG: hypothetical protein IKQ41_06090 [Clostridia bacterium]|nr:hypothetical protein [Clostridia bacterium]